MLAVVADVARQSGAPTFRPSVCRPAMTRKSQAQALAGPQCVRLCVTTVVESFVLARSLWPSAARSSGTTHRKTSAPRDLSPYGVVVVVGQAQRTRVPRQFYKLQFAAARLSSICCLSCAR